MGVINEQTWLGGALNLPTQCAAIKEAIWWKFPNRWKMRHVVFRTTLERYVRRLSPGSNVEPKPGDHGCKSNRSNIIYIYIWQKTRGIPQKYWRCSIYFIVLPSIFNINVRRTNNHPPNHHVWRWYKPFPDGRFMTLFCTH